MMFRYTNSISTPTRHKQPKLSKTPMVTALAVIGVFCCSSLAFGHDDKVLDPKMFELIDELERQEADYERKKSNVCDTSDRLIADKLARRVDKANFFPLEGTLNLIKAWEGYCKGREFDDELIRKNLQFLVDDKNKVD